MIINEYERKWVEENITLWVIVVDLLSWKEEARVGNVWLSVCFSVISIRFNNSDWTKMKVEKVFAIKSAAALLFVSRVTESGALEGISKVKKTSNGRDRQKESTLWAGSCIFGSGQLNIPRPADRKGYTHTHGPRLPTSSDSSPIETLSVVAVVVPTVWLCKRKKKKKRTNLLDALCFP